MFLNKVSFLLFSTLSDNYQLPTLPKVVATNLVKRNFEEMQGTIVIRVPSIVFILIHDDSLTNQNVRKKNLKVEIVIGVGLSSYQPQIRFTERPKMSIIDIVRSRFRCLCCSTIIMGLEQQPALRLLLFE